MKQTLTRVAMALVLFGIAFAWQSSNADDEKAGLTTRTETDAKQLELIERIEALEKRLEKLEAESRPIRQADHRDTPDVAKPDMLPSVATDEDHEGARKTNGQTWRIRMLSHRRSADGPR